MLVAAKLWAQYSVYIAVVALTAALAPKVVFAARRAPVEELFDGPALKLLARHEDLEPQEFWDVAEEVTGGRLVVTWSSSTTGR